MRVLFLTRYPESGASSRYRVYQYLPYLERAGLECVVSPLFEEAELRDVFRTGGMVRKALATVRATRRRVAWLRRLEEFDLVYFQREALPFGPPWFERAIRRRGVKSVFDYDDALFMFKPSAFSRVANLLKRPEKYHEIFSLVDCVLAGNDYLRDVAARRCPDARTFEVAEDTRRIAQRPPFQDTPEVVLGWLGSPSTEKYLNLIEPALARVAAKFPGVRLRIIGGAGGFRGEAMPVERVAWAYDTEVASLHGVDVGLMPLPDSDWSLGKCGGKARTYMAAGIPPVCTGIGYNLQLIRHGETGFLVRDQAEWEAALTGLVTDAAARQRVGDAARAEVIERFSPETMGAELAEILRGVAGASVPPR